MRKSLLGIFGAMCLALSVNAFALALPGMSAAQDTGPPGFTVDAIDLTPAAATYAVPNIGPASAALRFEEAVFNLTIDKTTERAPEAAAPTMTSAGATFALLRVGWRS